MTIQRKKNFSNSAERTKRGRSGHILFSVHATIFGDRSLIHASSISFQATMRFLFLALFTLSFSCSVSQETSGGIRSAESGDERKLAFVDRPIHNLFDNKDHGGPKASKGGSKNPATTKAPSVNMISKKEENSDASSKRKSKGMKEPKSKKSKSRSHKESKAKGSTKAPKNRSSKSKGKGKKGGGKTPTPPGTCYSPLANDILAAVPEAIAKNPERCCDFDGPSAVYITHSQASEETPSGFELFWDSIYNEIDATSEMAHVCFVMTGYNQSLATSELLSEILIDVNMFVSEQADVQSMMSTDPTESAELMQTIRTISESSTGPNIGVFNAGYDNIITESLVTGLDRLPFVGYQDDSAYGLEAARVSLELLGNQTAIPLCLNARPDLDFVGLRCSTYYTEITDEEIEPLTGVTCSANSTVDDIYNLIVDGNVTAVLAHEDCCTVAADARERAEEATGRSVIVGCTDKDTTGNRIDFVTLQPTELQGYTVSIWANFPVQHSLEGRDGKGEQYFPGLQSFANTAIFNIVIF